MIACVTGYWLPAGDWFVVMLDAGRTAWPFEKPTACAGWRTTRLHPCHPKTASWSWRSPGESEGLVGAWARTKPSSRPDGYERCPLGSLRVSFGGAVGSVIVTADAPVPIVTVPARLHSDDHFTPSLDTSTR